MLYDKPFCLITFKFDWRLLIKSKHSNEPKVFAISLPAGIIFKKFKIVRRLLDYKDKTALLLPVMSLVMSANGWRLIDLLLSVDNKAENV